MLFQLQAATNKARAATGDKNIAAQVARGLVDVVRAVPPTSGRGRYTVTVLRDGESTGTRLVRSSRGHETPSDLKKRESRDLVCYSKGGGKLAARYASSSPRIVPVAEANLSVSSPMRCSMETKRLLMGVLSLVSSA